MIITWKSHYRTFNRDASRPNKIVEDFLTSFFRNLLKIYIVISIHQRALKELKEEWEDAVYITLSLINKHATSGYNQIRKLTEGYDLRIEEIAMYTKARKQGRWFSLMANGSNMKRILTWKTIKKKSLKKSKTSAKKYLHWK